MGATATKQAAKAKSARGARTRRVAFVGVLHSPGRESCPVNGWHVREDQFEDATGESAARHALPHRTHVREWGGARYILPDNFRSCRMPRAEGPFDVEIVETWDPAEGVFTLTLRAARQRPSGS